MRQWEWPSPDQLARQIEVDWKQVHPQLYQRYQADRSLHRQAAALAQQVLESAHLGVRQGQGPGEALDAAYRERVLWVDPS